MNTSITIISLIILLILNLYGTYTVMDLSWSDEVKLTYNVSPNSNDVEDIDRIIKVTFNKPVKELKKELVSISYEDSLGEVEVDEEWVDQVTLEINLSRKLIECESCRLKYEIKYEAEHGIICKENLILAYE